MTADAIELIRGGELQRAIALLQRELESQFPPYGKTPTVYLRDKKGQLTSEINPECQWVFDGEGTPTYKWDGCNVRVEMHEGRVRTILGRDKKSQLPAAATNIIGRHLGGGLNGWYYAELVGPGINGNRHMRVAHSLVLFDHFLHLVPTCETPIATVVKACPSPCDEGVVWHHPDGRRAKLRAPDLKRAGIWPTELSGDS